MMEWKDAAHIAVHKKKVDKYFDGGLFHDSKPYADLQILYVFGKSLAYFVL